MVLDTQVPQQSMNGSAERLIGIIDTTAACLIYESGRPHMCREWTQTFATVLYSIRRTATVYGFIEPLRGQIPTRFDTDY